MSAFRNSDWLVWVGSRHRTGRPTAAPVLSRDVATSKSADLTRPKPVARRAHVFPRNGGHGNDIRADASSGRQTHIRPQTRNSGPCQFSSASRPWISKHHPGNRFRLVDRNRRVSERQPVMKTAGISICKRQCERPYLGPRHELFVPGIRAERWPGRAVERSGIVAFIDLSRGPRYPQRPLVGVVRSPNGEDRVALVREAQSPSRFGSGGRGPPQVLEIGRLREIA